MPSLSEILAKGLARLTKLDAKEQAVKEGKPLRVRTQITTLEGLEKQQERLRKNYLTHVMSTRGKILGNETEFAKIEELLPLVHKAHEQALHYLNDNARSKAILELDLLICCIKEEVANEDIDFVTVAIENFEDFNEGLRDYTLSVIEENRDIDTEKVKQLWRTCLHPEHIATLTRGRTVYDAIDFRRVDAVVAINNSKTQEEIEAAFKAYAVSVNAMLERFGLKYRVEV